MKNYLLLLKNCLLLLVVISFVGCNSDNDNITENLDAIQILEKNGGIVLKPNQALLKIEYKSYTPWIYYKSIVRTNIFNSFISWNINLELIKSHVNNNEFIEYWVITNSSLTYPNNTINNANSSIYGNEIDIILGNKNIHNATQIP